MERFTAFDLQRHVARVQAAAIQAPVAITHHGHDRLVLMDIEHWKARGRGDRLASVIKILQANRELLRQQGIAAISVFGSVARGDARSESDIDLLVEPSAGIRVGGLRLAGWSEMLGRLLGREADVVVREFLTDKVADSMAADLIEAVVVERHHGV